MCIIWNVLYVRSYVLDGTLKLLDFGPVVGGLKLGFMLITNHPLAQEWIIKIGKIGKIYGYMCSVIIVGGVKAPTFAHDNIW